MNFINQISEIGVTSDLTPSQEYKVKLLNLLALVSILIAGSFLIVHFFMKNHWLILLSDTAYILFSVIIIFFNHQKRYNFNNYFVAYGYTLVFVFAALYVGVANHGEYFLLLPGIACGFLFKNKTERLFLLIYSTFWFFAIKIFNIYYPLGILQELYLPHLHFINGAIILVAAFFITNSIIDNQIKLIDYLKLKNKEVQKLNATLEEKVLERTHKIEKQSKALAQYNQEIKKFSYIAAHDMREPLRNIVSFTQLMNKDIVNKNYEKIDEYSGNIDWSVRRINALIRNIVDYTNLDENINHSDTNDLNEIVFEVIKDSFERRKDAIFEVDALPTVQINKVVIKRLFKHLIYNAIQYCDKTQPYISISYEELSGFHQFCVKDNGIGIAQEYHDKIFEMFKRINSDIQQDGSGIGLSMCRKIVESYGGSIWVESELNEGSTFYFTLPK